MPSRDLSDLVDRASLLSVDTDTSDRTILVAVDFV